MKWQTSIGKAFEINKEPSIYGTFAEIGAGQETVNFFYKAGLASQTVAKSMSAYDMTVSDEIYGKQSRYVCKERLTTMLTREYHLLERRLKKKIGNKTCFFAFAVTAATSSQKRTDPFFNNQHAWMGLRFQSKAGQAFNDITFHVNCRDQSRLQQHEALGILGVNLIYAGFYCKNNPKNFLSSLTENLSGKRVEIQGMSCIGPAFKQFSTPLVNLESLSQNLSSMVFFPDSEHCEFLPDAVFEKSLVILYGDPNLIKSFKRKKSKFLKILSLNTKQTSLIAFVPKNKIKVSSFKRQLKELCKNNFSVLTAPQLPLEDLKKRLSSYSSKPILFIIHEDHFTKKMFDSRFYNIKSPLESLGLLFEKKTKLAVLSKNKNFSVKTHKLKGDQEQMLKDYLVKKKQILDLKVL